MTRFFNSLGPAAGGAILMVLAGALFAGVNSLMQYGAMVQGIASSRLAFWQYFIAFLCALPWIFTRGRSGLQTRQLPLHILRVALAAIGVQLWVAGLAHVPIWQAIALIMLSPFFVTLGAGLVLRETLTPQRWAALVFGFLGGMIILSPWSDAFTIYALLPVAAAAFWSLSSLLTKYLTRSESAESLTVYLLLLLTPLNAALAFGEGVGLSLNDVGLVLLGAGILTALAQYALVKAYSIADAAYLQPFDHVKLPFNVVMGFLVFGFVPPGALWIGSALIIGASFYLLAQERRPAVV